uniref:Uncharacterized protein n=1 Tax=Amphimedon queenslandica TaxID=400682 RepID=A0A1X7ST98_AMPQE
MQTDCKESKDTAKRQLLLPKGGFHGTHGTPLDPPLSMLEMILAPPVIVENAGKGRFTAVKVGVAKIAWPKSRRASRAPSTPLLQFLDTPL